MNAHLYTLPVLIDSVPHAVNIVRDDISIEEWTTAEPGTFCDPSLVADFREAAEEGRAYGAILVGPDGAEVDSLWGIADDSPAAAAALFLHDHAPTHPAVLAYGR